MRVCTGRFNSQIKIHYYIGLDQEKLEKYLEELNKEYDVIRQSDPENAARLNSLTVKIEEGIEKTRPPRN